MPAAGPGAGVRLFTSDAAVLEAQDVRKDLPCTVTPVKPALGFDLKFHAGYEVTVPLKELAGSENMLTMVFRVTPDDHPDEPVYFSQHIPVPSIADDAGGPAYLQGTFDVGEGSYHIDWLMRDRAERICSNFWDIEASLPAKDKQMALDISPDVDPGGRCRAVQAGAAGGAGTTRWADQREGGGQLCAAGFGRGHAPAAGFERPDFDSAEHRARAAHHPLLDCCVQHAGAAGDLPPGIGCPDRLSSPGKGAQGR